MAIGSSPLSLSLAGGGVLAPRARAACACARARRHAGPLFSLERFFYFLTPTLCVCVCVLTRAARASCLERFFWEAMFSHKITFGSQLRDKVLKKNDSTA